MDTFSGAIKVDTCTHVSEFIISIVFPFSFFLSFSLYGLIFLSRPNNSSSLAYVVDRLYTCSSNVSRQSVNRVSSWIKSEIMKNKHTILLAPLFSQNKFDRQGTFTIVYVKYILKICQKGFCNQCILSVHIMHILHNFPMGEHINNFWENHCRIFPIWSHVKNLWPDKQCNTLKTFTCTHLKNQKWMD